MHAFGVGEGLSTKVNVNLGISGDKADAAEEWKKVKIAEDFGADAIMDLSNSGKTREIVELTRLAHNLDPDLKFIVITGNPDSPLAKESDVCLSTGKPAEVCVLGMTPTTSTTAMTVIGDILVVQTMKETGFTIAEYSKRHHGGYLGEKSRSLCEK
jgi:arabinose-5-phosphate isomerase